MRCHACNKRLDGELLHESKFEDQEKIWDILCNLSTLADHASPDISQDVVAMSYRQSFRKLAGLHGPTP